MEINIAIVGPLISAIIQATKATGYLPSRYIPLTNVLMSLLVAMVYSWNSPIEIILNWGTIVLATAGTYEVVKRGTKTTKTD